jgi:hypothetical protein
MGPAEAGPLSIPSEDALQDSMTVLSSADSHACSPPCLLASGFVLSSCLFPLKGTPCEIGAFRVSKNRARRWTGRGEEGHPDAPPLAVATVAID